MLLDQRDLDLLRLIGLCKDIPADCSLLRCDMFSDTEFSILVGAGYIRKSKCGLSYRLTDRGHSLLSDCGYAVDRDAYPVGNSGVLHKRLETAKVILSLYRCGIEVFGDVGSGTFTSSFNFRRKNRGAILGSSQLCGILHLINQTLPVYFISEQTQLNVGIEMAAIRKISALLQSPNQMVAMFFADSVETAEQFKTPFDFRDRRSVWGDAFAIQVGWDLYEPPATPLEISIYA